MTSTNSDLALPPLVPAIEAVTGELIAEMIAFGASHYPVGNPNLDVNYFRWLCLQNPAGVAQAVVIRVEGRLVGQAIMVPVDLAHAAVSVRGYFVVSVLTHPEYRNRRLFSTIIDAASTFVSGRGEWLLGHPNAAALPGWKRKQMTFREPLVPHMAGLRLGLGSRIEVIRTEAELQQVWPEITARMAIVDERAVSVMRSTEYMLWRFMRRPDKHYRLGISRTETGEPAGFFSTTQWKHHLDLVVDHGCCLGNIHANHVDRPAIVMLPREVGTAKAGSLAAWRLPVRKTMPFFATTFAADNFRFGGVTLAASDF